MESSKKLDDKKSIKYLTMGDLIDFVKRGENNKSNSNNQTQRCKKYLNAIIVEKILVKEQDLPTTLKKFFKDKLGKTAGAIYQNSKYNLGNYWSFPDIKDIYSDN